MHHYFIPEVVAIHDAYEKAEQAQKLDQFVKEREAHVTMMLKV